MRGEPYVRQADGSAFASFKVKRFSRSVVSEPADKTSHRDSDNHGLRRLEGTAKRLSQRHRF